MNIRNNIMQILNEDENTDKAIQINLYDLKQAISWFIF